LGGGAGRWGQGVNTGVETVLFTAYITIYLFITESDYFRTAALP
jgi:hypothetical protein